MNKLTKASIAGGAAILLLMGGAGTLASWNATANAGGASAITAGELDIKLSETIDPVWSDADGPIADIEDYRVVPGDTLTYTATFDVTAVGDNLEATAAITPGSVAAATSGNAADEALAAALVAGATFTINGGTSSSVIVDNGTTQTVVVNATLTWDFGTAPVSNDTGDNAAKNGVVSLSNFGITLTQQ